MVAISGFDPGSCVAVGLLADLEVFAEGEISIGADGAYDSDQGVVGIPQRADARRSIQMGAGFTPVVESEMSDLGLETFVGQVENLEIFGGGFQWASVVGNSLSRCSSRMRR